MKWYEWYTVKAIILIGYVPLCWRLHTFLYKVWYKMFMEDVQPIDWDEYERTLINEMFNL